MTEQNASYKNTYTSLFIILIAAIIGALTGIMGSYFQVAVSWISSQRISISSNMFDDIYHNYAWAFFVAAIMGMFAYYLVQKFAPEANGSGIPEIEGALVDKRPVRWRRVLPVKFLGGLGALGSGMVLGREGPTVQMGANIGQMLADTLRIKSKTHIHTFLATGSAAGITTAFNAPLAGILFVIEEMHDEFQYSLLSVKALFAGVITSCIMYRVIISPEPIFYDFKSYAAVPLESLWLYLVLGIIFGLVGVMSNASVMFLRRMFGAFSARNRYNFVLLGGVLAGTFGLLALIVPEVSGGGFAFVDEAVKNIYALKPLMIILLVRFIATVVCFGSGAPGGIFSPTLALGTIVGILFGLLMQPIFPEYNIEIGACAIIGMAGLFASTIRAPLTGIVLVMEMSGNYLLILPLILACLGATFVAKICGGQPLYSAILQAILAKESQKAQG